MTGLDGAVEVLFFPQTYELIGQYIAEDAIVVVKGRVDRRDEQARIMAMDLSIPDINAANATDEAPVIVTLQATRCTPPIVTKLSDVINAHPGQCEIHLRLMTGGKSTTYRLGPQRVDASTALMADLKALLGAGSVGFGR